MTTEKMEKSLVDLEAQEKKLIEQVEQVAHVLSACRGAIAQMKFLITLEKDEDAKSTTGLPELVEQSGISAQNSGDVVDGNQENPSAGRDRGTVLSFPTRVGDRVPTAPSQG